jgi:DNA-binding PadR family transcriptional regulator
MPQKSDVPQGTPALMVLKSLDLLGPLHGYGIARRVEQISHRQLRIEIRDWQPTPAIVARFFDVKVENPS